MDPGGPRIVSLLASATEIVCAPGFERNLVGRSRECDFPESVRGLPVCSAPRLDAEADGRRIDEQVKARLAEILHPGAFDFGHRGIGLRQLELDDRTTR